MEQSFREIEKMGKTKTQNDKNIQKRETFNNNETNLLNLIKLLELEIESLKEENKNLFNKNQELINMIDKLEIPNFQTSNNENKNLYLGNDENSERKILEKCKIIEKESKIQQKIPPLEEFEESLNSSSIDEENKTISIFWKNNEKQLHFENDNFSFEFYKSEENNFQLFNFKNKVFMIKIDLITKSQNEFNNLIIALDFSNGILFLKI